MRTPVVWIFPPAWPNPRPPPLFAHHARSPLPKMETIYLYPPTHITGTVEDGGKYRCKHLVIWCIKQGSDVNWTEIRRPKATDIDYNTVAPFVIIVGHMLDDTRSEAWNTILFTVVLYVLFSFRVLVSDVGKTQLWKNWGTKNWNFFVQIVCHVAYDISFYTE